MKPMKTKPAICQQCGRRLPGIAPIDALVVCFNCTNPGDLRLQSKQLEQAAYDAADKVYGERK